ncbi:amino acid ABC transporter substrate-binding protein [Malaciobacter pacificus]|uniref:Periplasmic substrate-binding protein n=1 Tax=Malaciobacter pacificus TaxID=1080223 RepID=A0A5C2HBM8_9BACT|nr:ABC transporter substrate-binding protein [Malaciobacter pacificus]QEP34184.1 periplasmic substrate-binding protein [Malaciobacter pacificus]GGD39490.1 amino acid ABC transporter substrate-binding protein [Malaciobacter pacificus]
MKTVIALLIFFNFNLFAENTKLEKIITNNELRVCIWPQYYGISYIDSRTQKLTGIDIDLAHELAKDLNVKLKLVKSSFPTLIEDVTSNKCDIAMFAIGNTKARSEKMRFTTAHLQSDIYAITTKTNKKIKSWEDIDKNGVIVAVAKGTYHEPIMKKKLKNAKLITIKGFKQREQEVQSGRADVFMTDYPYSKKMLEKTDWAKLIKPTDNYHLTSYAWTMAYGHEEFYQRVEKFIFKIKNDGRLLKFAKKNGLEPIAKLR